MIENLARLALMLGNFVTGVAILGLAGMIGDLAHGLDVTISQAGLLVTYGAVVLCIGSPLGVWATSGLDRRMLHTGVLLIVAVANFVSAIVPDYAALLGVRLAMMAFAALYTPLAVSTVALIVPEKERASAITFVFLGFSLAVALGLPIVTFMSAHAGWRATFVAIGVACAVIGILQLFAVPRGVRGQPLSLSSWGALARHRQILLLLLLTTVQVSGQFAIFTYLAPLLARLADAGPQEIAAAFSLFGVTGFVGNLFATRLVRSLQPFRTSILAVLSMLLGFTLWSFGAGAFAVMGTGVAFWGLGFAAMNSMQQARLVEAAPALSSASVALNTSAIYIGQAIGSGLGGVLFAQEWPRSIGYLAMGFMLAALGLLALTRPKLRAAG